MSPEHEIARPISRDSQTKPCNPPSQRPAPPSTSPGPGQAGLGRTRLRPSVNLSRLPGRVRAPRRAQGRDARAGRGGDMRARVAAARTPSRRASVNPSRARCCAGSLS